MTKRITKPVLDARLRYMLHNTEREARGKPWPRIWTIIDNDEPNKLKIAFDRSLLRHLRLFVRVAKQRLAIDRAKGRRRKRVGA